MEIDQQKSVPPMRALPGPTENLAGGAKVLGGTVERPAGLSRTSHGNSRNPPIGGITRPQGGTACHEGMIPGDNPMGDTPDMFWHGLGDGGEGGTLYPPPPTRETNSYIGELSGDDRQPT